MPRLAVFLWSDKRGGGIQSRRVDLARVWKRHGVETVFFSVKGSGASVIPPEEFAAVTLLGQGDGGQRRREFVRALRENRFDCILVGSPRTVLVALLCKVLFMRDTRLVVSRHNSLRSVDGGLKGWLSDRFNQLALRSARRWIGGYIAVSNGVRDHMRRYLGIPAQREITVIYNAFDVSRAPAAGAGFHHPRRFVLGVGRLRRQKGFDMLIRAFASADLAGTDLLIAGEGSDRDSLAALCTELGVADRVVFLGYRADVLELMRAASCFVLSSRWEGFGNVLVEALAAQVPIVSFDCPHGPREILADGRFGLLVEPENTEALARAIEHQVRSGDGRNLRWRDFSLEQSARRYMEVMLPGQPLPDGDADQGTAPMGSASRDEAATRTLDRPETEAG